MSDSNANILRVEPRIVASQLAAICRGPLVVGGASVVVGIGLCALLTARSA